MTLLERLQAKIEHTESGCWLWTGAAMSAGYGHIWADGKMQLAHRVAYELFVGPIPDGLQLDHLCRNRLCANPAHLEPVTRRTNILRGEGRAAKNARRTECANGHDLSAVGYQRPNGARRCRACQNARVRSR